MKDISFIILMFCVLVHIKGNSFVWHMALIQLRQKNKNDCFLPKRVIFAEFMGSVTDPPEIRPAGPASVQD